jgi:asparagine synthase (glutamine-hydrolysing)
MCGIAGIVSRNPCAPERLRGALDSLGARGPDGSGVWRSPSGRAVFGHRRLAILDLSLRGAQPNVAPGGSSAFVLNGEIYNFRALRTQLEALGEQFVSTGDAEVAHALLRREGLPGLEELDGMFALAWWNEEVGRLLLARDHFGIKPLYYALLPSGIAFASQPSALLTLPELSARLDPEALSDYLSYGYVPFDRCIFAGIRKLPPAHRLLFEPATGRIDVAPYWTLERTATSSREPQELRSLLRESVESQLCADVSVGALLSGGLDSTTVTSLAVRQLPALRTFAVGYRDGDASDRYYARLASWALRTRHGERLLEVGELGARLAQAADIYEEPIADARGLPMIELARLCRKTVKVVLSGDGGDEVFGGYGWHLTGLRYEGIREAMGPFSLLLPPAQQLVSRIAQMPGLARAAGIARLTGEDLAARYFPVRGFFHAFEQEQVLGRATQDPAWLFRKFDRPELPFVHRLLSIDLHTYLPDNGLALVDRSTMAAGLEARVPLLSRRLVEHVFSFPADRLVCDGTTKVAFREAISEWLPPAILSRPKAGFSPPFKRWLAGPRFEAGLRTFSAGRLAADGIVDPVRTCALLRGGTQKRRNKLWLLLRLESWYRRWIVDARPDIQASEVCGENALSSMA